LFKTRNPASRNGTFKKPRSGSTLGRNSFWWAAGHAAGAIHLGKGIIERDIEQRIPDASATVVLYCGGGFRSALVADNLQKMGYKNVISMDGGWKGWVAAGYPTANDG
jgi:rhodanese-related sulfurtransferase